MIITKTSAPTETELLDFIEALTGKREQFASNLSEGIHNIVQLGNVVEVEATEDTEAVYSDRFHADIMHEHEIEIPESFQVHNPEQPRHHFS